MVKRSRPISPPVTENRVSPPIDPHDLFPDPVEDETTVSSVEFTLDKDLTMRRADLARLEELYRDVAELGEIAFVCVSGEPGLGKSFLVDQLIDSIERSGTAIRLLRAEPDATEVSYSAFATIIRTMFSVVPTDPEDIVRDKIARGVAEALGPQGSTEVSHLLAHLCRVPFESSPILGPLLDRPQQLQTRTFIALRRLFAAAASTKPLILIIENIDQCGDESLNLIGYLAAGLANTATMLLCTTTPKLFERHPEFGDGEVPLRKIELGPLTSPESVQLLCALGEQLDEIPDVLKQHAKRLGGSPRAILEFVRLLLESEVIVRSGSMSWRVDEALLSALKLPENHEELVRERVRVMPGIEADILEKAAAIGETFWLDAVVALVRARSHREGDPDGPTLAEIAAAGDHSRVLVVDTLQQLVAREWVVPVADPTVPGETEYRFAYPLLRDVVYDGISLHHRGSYHELVAQWLELLPSSHASESREAIALHFELAGNDTAAARCYTEAAAVERRRYAHARAIFFYTEALRCLGDTDYPSRVALWHDLGSVYELQGDNTSALGAYERMLRLAWLSSSRTKAAVAFNKMGRVWRAKGDLDFALEYLERGAELFEQTQDAAGIAGSLDDIGQVLHLLGRYDEAFDKITAALARRGERGDQRSIAHSLSNLGNIQKDRGYFVEAETCHREALAFRRDIGDREGVIISLNNLAALAYERGNYESARAGWNEALGEAERVGSLPLQCLVLANLGELARVLGHRDEARTRLREANAIATEIVDPQISSEALRNLALVEYAAGDANAARALAHQAIEAAEKAGLRDNVGRCYLALGEIASSTLYDADQDETPTDPSVPPAFRYFSKGIDILRDIGNESELARGLERFGRYRVENGDAGGGRSLLREALSIFTRLGMDRQREDVEAILAEVQPT